MSNHPETPDAATAGATVEWLVKELAAALGEAAYVCVSFDDTGWRIGIDLGDGSGGSYFGGTLADALAAARKGMKV